MNKFLYWLTSHLHCRVILVDDKPYLERYYITNTIFLHRFLSGDGDRQLHNHPWRYAFSFILTGWYTELRETRVVERRWFNIIKPDTFHRVISIRPGTWTLFLVSGRSRNWGFMKSNGEFFIMPPGPDLKDYRRYPLGCDAGRAPL